MISAQGITALVETQLTGRLAHNSRKGVEHAVQRLIANDPYWSLNLQLVMEAGLDAGEVLSRLITSLGLTRSEFEARDDASINPERTAQQLFAALNKLHAVARDGGSILLATGHPGSLLESYRLLGDWLQNSGGKIWELPPHTLSRSGHYLDMVGGVVVLSDEGALVHTHSDEGLRERFGLQDKPDIVVADHGFAAAAIDAGLQTVAIYDVDDPALPLAATLCDHVIDVPLNDNQTNLYTAHALRECINSYIIKSHG